MSKPAAPKGLNADGARLWREMVGKYVFRIDELVLLERACRAADRIAEMEAELAEGGVTSRGSMGQTVVHPLIPEIRAHSALVASLVKQLGVPDDPAGEAPVATSRSAAARKAAQSRWGQAYGKGA